MKISINNVFPILACAISGFEISEDDWKEDAPYCLLADIRNFLCTRAGPRIVTQLEEFGLLLENLLSNGDKDIEDLVWDSLEGLLECDRRDSIALYFGPTTQELWSRVLKGAP